MLKLLNTSNLFFTIITFCILISCGGKINKNEDFAYLIETELSVYSQYNKKEYIEIIIISDKDCYSCFDQYKNIDFEKSKNYLGLYYATDSLMFLDFLKKINPNINWVQMKNREILALMFKKSESSHGPYNLKRINGEYFFESF